MSTLLFVSIYLLVNVLFAHKCNHNNIHHPVPKVIPQIYKNHPYDKSNALFKRSLIELTESNTKPIRIRPYYDPRTISTSAGLTNSQITTIKQYVSQTINFFSKFTNVIPASSPLQFERKCTVYWDSAKTKCKLLTPAYCGISIPEQHYKVEKYWLNANEGTDTATTYGVGGADLVVYVRYDASCKTTSAYASPCFLNQYGRPIAAQIGICPSFLTQYILQEAIWTFVHELTHGMIMSPWLWDKFKDSSGKTMAKSRVVTTINNGFTYVISPKVKEWAQQHFGCKSLPGLPVEDDGGAGTIGSHWEQKFMISDNMSGGMLHYLSEAVLKLMEDSGWYHIDYKYADPYFWGKNAGCNFFSQDCVSKSTHKSAFPQFFCDVKAQNGCTYDNKALGACNLHQHSAQIPTSQQYFSDKSLGGPKMDEYCPWMESYGEYYRTGRNLNAGALSGFMGRCTNSQGTALKSNHASAVYDITSRCVNVKDKSTIGGVCFRHECFGYNPFRHEWNGVNIHVGKQPNQVSIKCEKNEKDSVKDVNNELKITCPNVDIICGSSSKPFACNHGHWNDGLNKCICQAGYMGTICNDKDTTIIPEAKVAMPLCGKCSSADDWVCSKVVDRKFEYGGTYNGRFWYYNSIDLGWFSIKNYIYFDSNRNKWLFGFELGGETYYSITEDDKLDSTNGAKWDQEINFSFKSC